MLSRTCSPIFTSFTLLSLLYISICACYNCQSVCLSVCLSVCPCWAAHLSPIHHWWSHYNFQYCIVSYWDLAWSRLTLKSWAQVQNHCNKISWCNYSHQPRYWLSMFGHGLSLWLVRRSVTCCLTFCVTPDVSRDSFKRRLFKAHLFSMYSSIQRIRCSTITVAGEVRSETVFWWRIVWLLTMLKIILIRHLMFTLL